MKGKYDRSIAFFTEVSYLTIIVSFLIGIVCVLLKLMGIIHWAWGYVLLPIAIPYILELFLCFVIIVVAMVIYRKEGKKNAS